ncbi:MAG: PAS domain S-box protein [Acidobacteria bacterium]|nr:PAS domain S-box protein [Acidobacteriota bacterium]
MSRSEQCLRSVGRFVQRPGGLEANVFAFGLAVRTYAQTGAPIYKNEAEREQLNVEANIAEYRRLASTERQRELAARIDPLWQEYKTKGLAVINGGTRFYSDAEWESIAASRTAMIELIRGEMQPDALVNYNAITQIAYQQVEAAERFMLIIFILCIVIAIVTGQSVSRAIVRSEREILSGREHLRATLTSIGDAVVTTDIEGRITSLNLMAERLTGWTEAEARGQQLRSVVQFIDDATGLEAESPSLKALREGTALSSDSVLLATRYGTKVPVEDHAAPVLNSKGAAVGSVLVFRDVTERKLHALELSKSYDELEARVKHRTFELAETHAELIREMEEHAIAEQKRIELLGRLVSGQETERRRIARDLHDQLGQRLTALRLKIASLKEAAAGNEVLEPKITRLQQIAEMLDSEVSYLAWELRPTALDDLGFAAAVRAFVKEWSRHFDIPADFPAAKIPKRRSSKDTETHLYRITQEALNNISKHAGATQVSVVLEKHDDRIILIIEDNGKGFDPASLTKPSRSGRGLGLLGMRERATLVGGDVEIESAPGSGTTIFVRVPMASTAKAANE